MLELIRQLLGTQLRFLAFQPVRPDLRRQRRAWLAYVLVVTWLVGIGRYWDHPRAELWQYAGLGSLAYIGLLSLFVYLLVLPLRPARWSYPMVLVFVGLTSLPALLYAIPVERFTSLETAQQLNVAFLGVVATWRVALYVHFLRNAAALSWPATIVACLLPLCVIVVSLLALNLEHVVFQIMAGIRDEDRSANDDAYAVVFLLSMLATLCFPFVLAAYLALTWLAWRYPRHAAGDQSAGADTGGDELNQPRRIG